MSFAQKSVFACCLSVALGLMTAAAETVFWGDDFETNAGSRWTTNSIWQIGSPTTGPAVNSAGFRAHGGSKCATTGLKGAVASNVDARLVCTNYNGSNYLTVPAASQSPRLRFWQWYDFANSAGVVELQVAGTTNWQAISMTNLGVGGNVNTGSAVWSRPSLDLSAFAGENVQVAFHFGSGAKYGTDLGWYIDDVALVTGPPVFHNPEGFEGGLGDWAVNSGTWEVGVPTSGPPVNSKGFRAHSGTNCAATVLAGNYGWNLEARLTSPPFTVPSTGSQALRFAQWYSFINAASVVEVNSGFAITNLSTVTNVINSTNSVVSTNTSVIVTNFVTVTNTTYVTNTFVTPVSTNVITTASLSTNDWQAISTTNVSAGSAAVTSNGQWVTNTLDLSQFSGQTIQVAFHFESGAGGYGSAAGWYIDDLSLLQGPVVSLLSSITITNGQTFTVSASATNTTLPDAKYLYSLAASSTNAFIATNGVLTWTNTRAAFGTSVLSVKVADDSQPPFYVTNKLTVTVAPLSKFSASNTLSQKYFLVVLQSVSNTTWQIDASTNLTSWQPVFTNTVPVGGFLQFTDLLATNFPYRFYRAVTP